MYRKNFRQTAELGSHIERYQINCLRFFRTLKLFSIYLDSVSQNFDPGIKELQFNKNQL